MSVMRCRVAVDRWCRVAETCTRLASLWEDHPLGVGAERFGELLEAARGWNGYSWSWS
jgi:hypothetical protein